MSEVDFVPKPPPPLALLSLLLLFGYSVALTGVETGD
jgi:hypothetical protein